MSLRLDIKKKLLAHSPRVKAVDFHPELPWILSSLYNGSVAIHDYQNQTCIKTLEVSQVPVRTARFIAKKQWIVAGSDDMMIRVYNYNTMERVKAFEAHNDFLRCVVVHPQESYILSCSDDFTVKLWDYEKDFALVRTFSEHKNFIMQLAINPRDLSKFASASMDKSIKIWNITAEGKANFTLLGHTGGVNCVDFYKGDKPYIASGSDDRVVKLWDYQTKQCIVTIEGHLQSVSAVQFHPELPIILSTSETGIILVHNSSSFALQNTLEYKLERAWSIAVSKENPSIIAFGFDEGTVAVKIGPEEPVVSMCQGKLLWTRAMQVISANVKAVSQEELISEKRFDIVSKELGTLDMFPTMIKHSPDGHLFAACNDKEFAVIRTATFKNAKFGTGSDLSWSLEKDFAVRDNLLVKIYRNFEVGFEFKPENVPIGLQGGHLLAVVGATSTSFYDWEHVKLVTQAPFSPKKILWNDEGTAVAFFLPEKLLLMDYDPKRREFSATYTLVDKITSGTFAHDLFFYLSASGKIYFTSKGKTFFYCNAADRRQMLIGTVEQQNRLYAIDKNYHMFSYELPFGLAKSLSLIAAGKQVEIDVEDILPQYRDRTAKFLDAFGLKQNAYEIVQNTDHKFELAVSMNRIRDAYQIAKHERGTDKLKIIGDIAVKVGDVELAMDCYDQINDLNGLLLIYSSLSLLGKLKELGSRAEEVFRMITQLTRMNVAFQCYFMTNQPSKCVDVLLKSSKYPEAALFARTYFPERVSECVRLWKHSIENKSIAGKIADPNELPEQEGQQEGQEEEQES